MKAFSRTRWLFLATAALSTALHAQQPTPAADRESRVTSNAVPAVVPAATPTPVAVTTTTGGTKGTIPMFSSASNIENSTLYYNATGLGIGRFPSQMLDVNGNSVFRGYMQVSRTADATASMGTKSYPIQFNLQVFDSTRGIALNPFFNFQAEPKGNNTASTGATLNLLYFGGVGAPTAAETGLYFNNNGVIHFASGQTFPITQGPAGPQGPVGPAGPKGATGPTGPQGPTGTLALPYVASGPGSYLFYLTNTGSTVGGGIYAEGSSGSAQSTFGGVGLTGGGGTGGTANFVNGGIGVLGLGGHAGPGQFASGGTGVRGVGADTSAAQTYGGDGGYFTGGQGPSTGGYGIIAIGADGLNGGKGGDGINAYSGVGGNYAGLFYGNVSVVGNLSKSGGSFKIDDPIDPENKYLSHSFVESPDMKNIYDGNIVTDGSSRAVVELPDYFEALNRDFRYQLTAIGRPAKVWIAAKVTNNRFIIQTDEPGVEVSWQVTGIRQDAWANAHRIPNEEEKTPTEKGHFIHPELFGHGGEISTNEIGHPRNRRPTEKQ